jgi:hypothetical protein
MPDIKKKRRPKGQAAIGDIHQTKVVVTAMISDEAEQRRKKTEWLRALRAATLGDTVKTVV